MRKKPVVFLLLGVLLACVLSACGGGGGGTTTAPAAIQFELSAPKNNVLSDNTDSADITATFVSAVAAETPVTFSVPSGTAATLSVPGTNLSGSKVTAPITTGNRAKVAIKGNNLTGPVIVTATSGSVTKTTTITFNPSAAANVVQPAAPPTTTTETVSIVTPVTTDTSQLVISTSSPATVGPIVQNGSGQFSVPVTTPTLDPVTVSVSVVGSTAPPSTVTVTPVVRLQPSSSPAAGVPANGITEATVTVDFSKTGVTVPDNELVTFTATNGAILSSTQAATSNNIATVNVKSSNPGTSIVTASYKGSTGPVSVDFVKQDLTMSTAKSIALANGTDTVTLTATLTNAPDNTVITFAATPGTATLTSGTTSTSNGVATATATVKSATPGTVTITATSGSATATTTVNFIAQPTAMDVFVALNPAQPSLASLQFVVDTGAGATVPPTATVVNAAATGSFVAVGPGSAANTTNVALINATGFNTMTAPIIKLTYTITGSGLPGAQINTTAPISAFNAALQPITLTPQNFVITTEYR